MIHEAFVARSVHGSGETWAYGPHRIQLYSIAFAIARESGDFGQYSTVPISRSGRYSDLFLTCFSPL
jgi:hypothetical protein